MRKVAERVPIARHAFTLPDEERIEIPRHAAQLAWIPGAERVAAPLLHFMNLPLEPAHRSEDPAQQSRESHQQQQHQTDEPADELPPKLPQLLLVRAQADRYAE